MTPMQLVFDGIAWPAAKVSDRQNQFEADESAAWSGLKPITFARISTTGHGRAWSTTTALGWWRTFSEMNLQDDETIAGFVRRYGDPSSQLSPSKPVHTNHWLTLQTVLQPLALAWLPFDEFSELREDGAPEVENARLSLDVRGPLFMEQKNIDHLLDRHGFGYRYRLLGDFMFASAADMLFRKAKMRRCEVCGHWFEIKRKTARVCSAACHFKKATGGKRIGSHQQA